MRLRASSLRSGLAGAVGAAGVVDGASTPVLEAGLGAAAGEACGWTPKPSSGW
jgi:hypothetical protein